MQWPNQLQDLVASGFSFFEFPQLKMYETCPTTDLDLNQCDNKEDPEYSMTNNECNRFQPGWNSAYKIKKDLLQKIFKRETLNLKLPASLNLPNMT